MANAFYNRAAKRLLAADENYASATLKLMLVDSGYTFNRDHDVVGSGVGTPGGEEVTGTGYTGGFGGTGRKTLANKVFSEDDANDRGELDCDDVTWLAISVGAIAAAILIVEKTSDSDSELIGYIDSGFPVTTSGEDLVLKINAEGLLQLLTT